MVGSPQLRSLVPPPVLLGERAVILLQQPAVALHQLLAGVGVHLLAPHVRVHAPDLAVQVGEWVLLLVGGLGLPEPLRAAALVALLLLARLLAVTALAGVLLLTLAALATL